MNMPDDKAVSECLHGIAENITADGLDDILHELWTVGFDAFPFLRGFYAFVGNGFAAILVFSDARLHVGKQAA